MNPPRVFISYSHDTSQHKKWVLSFATTLRNRGVDAVLDQWDLKPVDDLPHFMETQLENCDFALMICTETYVEKANAGAGGVGYEKMIMTSSMMSKIDGNKIIPIIRQNGSSDRPTFLKTKLYIDFSNDEDNEYSFDDLLRTLLDAPLFEKPEIGTNPFVPMENARPDRTTDGIKSVMEAISITYNTSDKPYIYFANLVRNAKMHRLTIDRYLAEAVKEGLVIWEGSTAIKITEKGRDYVFSHDLV